jgi:hypothetical protein
MLHVNRKKPRQIEDVIVWTRPERANEWLRSLNTKWRESRGSSNGELKDYVFSKEPSSLNKEAQVSS